MANPETQAQAVASSAYPIRGYWAGPRAYWVASGQTILGVPIQLSFLTDGGSIPLALNWYADPFGIGLPAFVLHDYRYRFCDSGITRAEADAELRANLIACGMSRAKAQTLYLGVRAFGASHWSEE